MTIEDLERGGSRLRPLTKRFKHLTSSWRERLYDPRLVRQYHFPSPHQKNLIKNIAQVVPETGEVVSLYEESIDIIEEVGGYSLDRKKLLELLQKKKSSPLSRKIRGGQIEVHTTDDTTIADFPQFVRLPDHLSKIVGVTGLDLLIADLFDDKANHPRQFTTCIVDGETHPLWDDEGRANLPQRLFRYRIGKLQSREAIEFRDEGGLTMKATALPIQKGNEIPRFILAVDEKKADNYKDTLDEAREENLAIVWLVKKTQLGIMKALFWQAAHGGVGKAARVFIQDERGNRYDFEGRPLGGQRFTRERKPGTLDFIIEYRAGNLEPAYENYNNGIQAKHKLPQHEGILTVGIADITETGGSLITYHLKEVLEAFPCPPMAVTFPITP